WKAAGHDLVVVRSAMAGETDRLIGLAKEIQALPDPRELDVVAATGEQVTIGLLAMALMDLGVKARSYTGWQVKIVSDSAHNKARIISIDQQKVRADLHAGYVVVVAGFQGVDSHGNLTTLGRGGSDTSAVALAAALKADLCDIYTDVDGVYTTDPRITSRAKRLERISYEEMLELASLGAKVLQTRSVELAMVHRVPVRVLSTFDADNGGTLVCDEEDIVEKNPVTGIAYTRDEAKITLLRVPDQPGVAAAIFGPLADAGVNVDMIVQNVSEDGRRTDLTFTVQRADLDRALDAIRTAAPQIGYKDLISEPGVAKVSIIGIGMRAHPGVAQT